MLERKNCNERQGKQSQLLLKNVSSLFALDAFLAPQHFFFVPHDWPAAKAFQVAGSPRSRLTFQEILEMESLKYAQARKLSEKDREFEVHKVRKMQVLGMACWLGAKLPLLGAGA